jgi:hypothetical protein
MLLVDLETGLAKIKITVALFSGQVYRLYASEIAKNWRLIRFSGQGDLRLGYVNRPFKEEGKIEFPRTHNVLI